jgi:lysozyme
MTRVPTTNQAAALVSLAYNVGVGARDDDGKIENLAESTLLAKFEAGDDMGAANEFPKWNKARVRGQLQPLAGLTKRRNMERELFLK